MGSLRSPSPAVAREPAAAAEQAAAPATRPQPGQRYDDPWIRGLVMAPSVRYSMSVAVIGSIDYRLLQPLLHKPHAAVAMAFSGDPNFGLTAEQFAGSAVDFLPTITFGARTAQLR
jgi:hypothetical protein